MVYGHGMCVGKGGLHIYVIDPVLPPPRAAMGGRGNNGMMVVRRYDAQTWLWDTVASTMAEPDANTNSVHGAVWRGVLYGDELAMVAMVAMVVLMVLVHSGLTTTRLNDQALLSRPR